MLLTELDVPETEDDATELTAQELEARAVGEEIRRMVGRVPVLDKETGNTGRPATGTAWCFFGPSPAGRTSLCGC